jgi:fluoride exporter
MPPVLAVVLGGVVGTGLRIGLDALIRHDDTTFPWSTLLINIVGSFVLGLLVARVWPVAPAWARAGLGAGLMGSFTTFSAFAVSLVTLTRSGMTWLALVYLLVSVVAGFAAAWLGLRFGRRPEPLERNE